MTTYQEQSVENANDVDQRSVETLAEALGVDKDQKTESFATLESASSQEHFVDTIDAMDDKESPLGDQDAKNVDSERIDNCMESLHEGGKLEQQPRDAKENESAPSTETSRHHRGVTTPPADSTGQEDLPKDDLFFPFISPPGESTFYYALTVATSGDLNKESSVEEKTCALSRDNSFSLQGHSFDSSQPFVMHSNKENMEHKEREDASSSLETQRTYSEHAESTRTTSQPLKTPLIQGVTPSIQFVQAIPPGLQTLKVIPTLQHPLAQKFACKIDDTHAVNTPCSVTPLQAGHALLSTQPGGRAVLPVPQYLVPGSHSIMASATVHNRQVLSGLVPILPARLPEKQPETDKKSSSTKESDALLDLDGAPVRRATEKLTPVESFNNVFIFAKKVIIRTSLLMQYLFCTIAVFYCTIAITTPEWFRNTVEYSIDGIKGHSHTYVGLFGLTRSDAAKLKDGTTVTLQRGPIKFQELYKTNTFEESEFVEQSGCFRSIYSVGNLGEEKTEQFTELYGNIVYDVVAQETKNLEYAGELLFYLALISVAVLGAAILLSFERGLSEVVRPPWRILMRNLAIFLWIGSVAVAIVGFTLWAYWSGGSIFVSEDGKMVPGKLFYSAYFFITYMAASGLGLVFYIVNCVALPTKRLPRFERTSAASTSIDIGV
ncbi:hypothetical protein BEWA_048850 [Theileria equi strain WA]|uniref:Uncharacterized protein n=1 Tax=Theileria equi strain WA TaxID=1537102 RepID=L1LB84_THEEQ|nr:hypothetical protein BEWA_048850 [Theileria equi strain WA]EKX72418.1 hypothetical protein BEWA_048850 [Theileria equi strain WA]|eukprot:XP_004831870.1 hypothetical protein BEWA_048850 [Theileria equi strain WA]